VHADDGQVGQRVGADHVELGLGALGEGGGAAARAGDHVGIGEQESVVGEGDRRARAGPARGTDGQRRDGRQQLGGDAGHDTAVGIERARFDTRVFGIHAVQNTGPAAIDAGTASAHGEMRQSLIVAKVAQIVRPDARCRGLYE
jgi:hypothetical protein